MGELPLDINIQEPRWDQSTFLGRARHFFTVTDPRNLLLSAAQLETSRNIVQNYRKTPTVVFWQWVNQSFNAIVNYSNRSGDTPITVRQLGTAYVSATTGAVATALGLKSLTKHLPPLVGRFVPFAAVAAANCINIPLMRQRELQVGIPVADEAGQRLGYSVTAAKQGIFQVVISRICMAIPAMAIPPLIMDTLEKKDFLKVGGLRGQSKLRRVPRKRRAWKGSDSCHWDGKSAALGWGRPCRWDWWASVWYLRPPCAVPYSPRRAP
ncbi:sideroflexin-3 isoform X3 [Trachypithecus francoisi]|uniref:sideroflexin-3 isoform X3 n=1 Tax=Trachypithecus francoisi TaxID=54180 RepID=UPI00141BCE8A|nr:sideroflexin-3 isoform X3 [Trachypithecus francoisi]